MNTLVNTLYVGKLEFVGVNSIFIFFSAKT